MRINGQYFGPQLIERISSTIEKDPDLSFKQLSKLVCQWLDWRARNGKLKEIPCRAALNQLEKKGLIKLKKQKFKLFQKKTKALKDDELDITLHSVSCTLGELGDIEIIPVSSKQDKLSKIWKHLMHNHHYLETKPLCGAQIRYLIKSECYGWLGALAFNSATLKLKDRDETIGWSPAARNANLHLIVNNRRFLILPTVEVPNLASHVLSKILNRLADDWQKEYNYSPVLVETFVDPTQFAGSCYKGANWKKIGQTAGRSTAFANGKIPSGKKDLYIYPLNDSWQATLQVKPEACFIKKDHVEEPENWVANELSTMEVEDPRLISRAEILMNDFFARPGAPIPEACLCNEAKVKGAYRFFKNEQITMQTLLKPHFESSAARAGEHNVILAVQDTSSLNYTHHPGTDGLGPINTTKDSGTGLLLHDTMAFTPEGVPLGLLDIQLWARNPEDAGKSKKRGNLPIEEKESFKWLTSYRSVAEIQALYADTQFVSVGDRESDIYELFVEAKKTSNGPDLLIRSNKASKRKLTNGNNLWDTLEQEKIAGYKVITILGNSSKKEREAKLAVSFKKIKLAPPTRKKDFPAITMWAVYAKEVDPPAEIKEPVEWLLLSTIEVSNFDEALEKLAWYEQRWGIEVYHRVLKSGCRIEDRRLAESDRLENCLSLDIVVAWRIHWLTMMGRETPDIPASVFFSEAEWLVLTAYRDGVPTEEPPTLYEAMMVIAQLGGFIGRQGDGYPGPTPLWRGLDRLSSMVEGFLLRYPMLRGRPPPPMRE